MSRRLTGTCLALLLEVLGPAGPAWAEVAPVRLVLIGDSLIVSKDVNPEDGYAAGLQAALTAEGVRAEVVGTGLTSTTRTGLRYLGDLLTEDGALGGAGPKAVILELGSNDCFRSTLSDTEANLTSILKTLSDRHIPVLIAGTLPYDICAHLRGADYPAGYVQMFADLATRFGAVYYPDFKDGLYDQPDLLQSDRDHPTAKGDAVIVERILPLVIELVHRAEPS